MRHSALYTLGFAAAVCLACSIVVAASAVALRPRQEQNLLLDRQSNVLAVAGLIPDRRAADPERIQELFERHVRPRLIDRETGEYAEDEATLLEAYNMQRAMQDAQASVAAPSNPAQVPRLPDLLEVYEIVDEADALESVVIPVQGMGLWSTLYGFVALDDDGATIRGLTFYQHGETPGLGGEVDNPRWKDLWPGRRAFDDGWNVRIEVIKGQAGPPEEDPHRVDGLAGATMTSRGVTHLLEFWLGPEGYLPYLQRMRGAAEAPAQST